MADTVPIPQGATVQDAPPQAAPTQSDGAVPIPQGATVQDQQPEQGAIGKAYSAYTDTADALTRGGIKGLGQVVHTAGEGWDALTGGYMHGALEKPLAKLDEATQTHGTAEKVGAGLEGLVEMLSGDELLKGASIAEKLGLAGKIAKLAEAHPFAAKLINGGLRAVRSGGVQAGESALHGAGPEEVAETGAAGAALSGAGEAVGGALNVIKPRVSAEGIPVRASASSVIRKALEHVADSGDLKKFDVEQTQPAALKAMGRIADEAKTAGLAKNAIRAGTEAGAKADTDFWAAAKKEIGWPGKGSLSDVLTRAQEMKAKAGVPSNTAHSFEEASDILHQEAKPTYDKLDELTKHEDTKFSDYQRMANMAGKAGNFELKKAAVKAQEEILDRYETEFKPDEYKKAKALWRQGIGLDEISDRIFGSKSIIHPTPPELLEGKTLDPGYVQGKALSSELLQMRQDKLFEKAGLSADHVQALQNIATTLAKGNNTSKMNAIVKIAAGFAAAGHPGPGVGALGGTYVASRVLGKLMTDPRAAIAVDKILETGIGTPAAVSILKPIFSDDTEQKPKESL